MLVRLFGPYPSILAKVFEGIRTACRAVDLLFTQRLRHSKGPRPCLGIELVLDTTSTNQVGVEDFL
jgi:hypothetical protein